MSFYANWIDSHKMANWRRNGSVGAALIRRMRSWGAALSVGMLVVAVGQKLWRPQRGTSTLVGQEVGDGRKSRVSDFQLALVGPWTFFRRLEKSTFGGRRIRRKSVLTTVDVETSNTWG